MKERFYVHQKGRKKAKRSLTPPGQGQHTGGRNSGRGISTLKTTETHETRNSKKGEIRA